MFLSLSLTAIIQLLSHLTRISMPIPPHQLVDSWDSFSFLMYKSLINDYYCFFLSEFYAFTM